MEVALLLLGVVCTSCVIWFSSKGISAASEMWGCGWSPGIRGATINAIASSIPELFTTIVFLVILGDSEGFVSGISTVAGSAVFNVFVIPGVMILAVFFKYNRPLKEHKRSIVLRDGSILISVQAIIYFFIYQGAFKLWHAGVLLFIYALYILILIRKNRDDKDETVDCYFSPETRRAINIKFVLGMIGVGVGCYYLVELCIDLGTHFNLEIPVIALVIAAAATSVPDTFLSVRDAGHGKTDDAISNAFGSNIFDLCVALGLPLLIYCMYNGEIALGDEMKVSLSIIWLILMGLTVVALAVMYISRRLNIYQSLILLTCYFTIVGLVVYFY